MGIIRRYFLYKRLLQVLFVINIILVLCGIAALVQYFKTEQVTSLSLVVVGFGTLVFGIALPIVIIDRLLETINVMRKQTEESVAKFVAGWIENYKRNEDPIRDAHFWINVALLTAELVTENSRHPVGRLISEFAPLMKAELSKSSKKNKGRKVTA